MWVIVVYVGASGPVDIATSMLAHLGAAYEAHGRGSKDPDPPTAFFAFILIEEDGQILSRRRKFVSDSINDLSSKYNRQQRDGEPESQRDGSVWRKRPSPLFHAFHMPGVKVEGPRRPSPSRKTNKNSLFACLIEEYFSCFKIFMSSEGWGCPRAFAMLCR